MTKGVSRQPEGVTPAYSQTGSEKRRKRRTRDTSSFYGAQARFRTDNVDPIENAYASCLKAIDCFSSNMSETAALCLLPPLPPSPSHVAPTKSLSVNCINAVLANVSANMYENTRQTSICKSEKKLGKQKIRVCVWAQAQISGRRGHF